MIAIAVAVALQVPALTGTWQYRALNEQGRVIAHGPVKFREYIPKTVRKGEVVAWTHIGTRKIKEVRPNKYGPHGEGAPLHGMPPLTIGARIDKDGTFHADMSKGWNDHNIILDGKLQGKRIEGNWTWNAFTGGRAKGTFTLTRTP